MNFKIAFLLCAFFLPDLVCPAQKGVIPVIPMPLLVKVEPGFFVFGKETILFDSLNEFPGELKVFNEQLLKVKGYTLAITSHDPGTNFISVFHGHQGNTGMPAESYTCRITKPNISLIGYPEGIMHGLETVFQLIGTSKEGQIACAYINDAPQFAWRGMHLDVCRHFFTKEEVKKYIDYLTLYKFNMFHWHLTEDQGWRIEIKKYPLLTEIGSRRAETVVGRQSDTARFDGIAYGGFYTQDDIRDVVAYATERHITIVPEIEMPGHAQAALAAYPQYSCTKGPFKVGTHWGEYEEVYCPREETFHFLEDILSEVCDLFPGPYIHIGGDECPKKRWKSCSDCQALMKKEGLKDENELQSYFIGRIERYLNSKGRNLVGWDEILEGGLSPNATVMSWRGMEGGIAAATQKHNVVMSPGKPCYFDHYQTRDRSKEPLAIGGYNPIENVYAYNPIPKKLPAEDRPYILGAQGNVWTEYIVNFKQVEYMAIPRMIALSEALWSRAANKNYPEFRQRLIRNASLLDAMQVNYSKQFMSLSPNKTAHK
jgi:hexosaminidase